MGASTRNRLGCADPNGDGREHDRVPASRSTILDGIQNRSWGSSVLKTNGLLYIAILRTLPNKSEHAGRKSGTITYAPAKPTPYQMKGKRQHTSSATAGKAYLAWDLPTAARRISEGLPTGALDTIQARLGLSNAELAAVVQISLRTLSRRKKEALLPPDESERVYRINRLAEIAAQVLGGESAARDWMREPNFTLGDETPLSMARTEPGAKLVERVLGQIDHGIMV